MNFYWVNVGQTNAEVFEGSFLWAPLYSRPKTLGGKSETFRPKTHEHWRIVGEVRRGDVIFGNVDQRIVFVAVATADAYHASCPPGRVFSSWHEKGNRIDIQVFPLHSPVSVKGQIRASFEAVHNLTSSQKVFTIKGTIFQGYMASISDAAGVELLSYVGDVEEDAVEASNKLQHPVSTSTRTPKKPVGATTRQAVRDARIGQGYFRKRLLDLWEACPVTGLSEPSLLIASHIKPWSKSDDDERLDHYNGFLLAPHIDRLFDKGLIGFDNSGSIIISTLLKPGDQTALGIHTGLRIPVEPDHVKYLEEHRKLFSL